MGAAARSSGPDHAEGKHRAPKSPINAVLRDFLAAETGGGDQEPSAVTLAPEVARRWALRSWRGAPRRRGRQRSPPRNTLHECRHTFASPMIAAGVNAKARSTFIGHSTIAITLDHDGHLTPDSVTEVAGPFGACLVAQKKSTEEVARTAGAVLTGE